MIPDPTRIATAPERQRGSSPRQYWWEQTFDLDAARAASAAIVAAGDDD